MSKATDSAANAIAIFLVIVLFVFASDAEDEVRKRGRAFKKKNNGK